MSKITLILGGASCGKSRFAESLADNHTDKLYLATAEGRDEEMKNRIDLITQLMTVGDLREPRITIHVIEDSTVGEIVKLMSVSQIIDN